MNVRISLQKSCGVEHGFRDGLGQPPWNQRHSARPGSLRPIAIDPQSLAKGVEANDVRQDCNEQRLIYKCILDPSVDNSGYAGVVRVVRIGGSARIDGDTLVVENASSVMLLTRIEYFPDFSDDKVESLRQAVEGITPDYAALLERHRKVQSEMLNRVTVDFGGASQYGMVDGGTPGRSAVQAGLLARVAGEDF